MNGTRPPEGQKVYIWTECGNGSLYEVVGASADYWVRTANYGGSFCCHGGTALLCLSPKDHLEVQRDLQAVLKARRDLWNKPGFKTFADWGKLPSYPQPLPFNG